MLVSLIIQGPIVSTGVTGAFQGAIREAEPHDIKSFDSTATIISNARAAKDSFDFVVYSGWEYDSKQLLAISSEVQFDGLRISAPIPPNRNLKPRNTKLQQEHSQAKLNNMQSQFKSTLAGLTAARELGATHAIKIRSDQQIDIPRLSREFRNLCDSQYSLFVPAQDFQKPWALSDFYMGGSIDYLIEYFESLANPQNGLVLSQNVHDNLFFTLALKERDKITNLQTISCLVDYINFTELHINASKHLWGKVIFTFSEDLYGSTLWRGEQMVFSKNQLKFGEQVIIPNSLNRKRKPRRFRFYGYLYWVKSILGLI